LPQARQAAQGADVWLAGGASVANQYLAAGLVDELDVSIAPVLLGTGERLFEEWDGAPRLEQVRAVRRSRRDPREYRVRQGGALGPEAWWRSASMTTRPGVDPGGVGGAGPRPSTGHFFVVAEQLLEPGGLGPAQRDPGRRGSDRGPLRSPRGPRRTGPGGDSG